jgi:hypothetical protein
MPILLKYALLWLIAGILCTACGPSLKPDNLYGKWNYTRLENPGDNPPSTEPDWKLKMDKPSIEFSKNNELTIWWAGKILSHGTFSIDGKNIRYKQMLADGRTNEFPFYVTKFTGKEMVFETLGKQGTRVTAVKE